MRSVFFLSDSFSRRLLDIYCESGLHLPNLDRLIGRSAVFDGHWAGSAPCMPARRDILTGRLNFLDRNWGPIEAFDYTLPQALRAGGVKTHMITDHYHYFEIGGENYCQMFDSWELYRGQEGDPWISTIDANDIPEHCGRLSPQYWCNRKQFIGDEAKYSSAMTIQSAANFLEEHHASDNFLLWVEVFDPHEPFDVPQKYLDMVGDDYEGNLYIWPEYKPLLESGVPEQALRHVEKRYLALTLMVDQWMGKIFDVMDAHDMWKDTAFIFTTDHGLMLGEHGHMVKNYMPAYNEVYHLPLFVHLPNDAHAGKRIGALTQNLDVLPTVLDLYGIDHKVLRNPIHGKSWMPLLEGDAAAIREYALYGIFGKQVNITDGHHTYLKAPVNGNRPLNLYTSMPTDVRCYFDADRISDFSAITAGRYLSWTDYPVYRIPVEATKNKVSALRYYSLHEWELISYLFDIDRDYAQAHNLMDEDPALVARMDALLKRAMAEHDAPKEQFERLNL